MHPCAWLTCKTCLLSGKKWSLCCSNYRSPHYPARLCHQTHSKMNWRTFMLTILLAERVEHCKDRVAQWIRRLTTNQEIEGSSPFVVVIMWNYQSYLKCTEYLLCQNQENTQDPCWNHLSHFANSRLQQIFSKKACKRSWSEHGANNAEVPVWSLYGPENTKSFFSNFTTLSSHIMQHKGILPWWAFHPTNILKEGIHNCVLRTTWPNG